MTPMNRLFTIRGEPAATLVQRFAALRPVTLACVVLAFVAAACSSSSDGTTPSVDPAAADVTIISRDMAFDQSTITIPADSSWSLQLVNEEAAPHNVAIYTDESAEESLFVGEMISSTTIVYHVPTLEPGAYFFRCDLHPEMNGTLVVES